MPRSSRRRVRRLFTTWHRPKLEHLEARLPPGDALLGLLLMWPELTLDISEPDHEVGFSFGRTSEGTPAFATASRASVETPAGFAVDEPKPTPHSPDSRAAGLIPAVRTAGINPAARYNGAFRSSEPTSDLRAAGLIPAVRTAGINSTARSIVQGIGDLTTHVPGLPAPMHSPDATSASDSQTSKVMDDYGNVPLTFEANHGQTDARVDFIARTGGAAVFLTPTTAVFAIQNSESRIQNSESEPEAFATRTGPASVAYASGSDGIDGVAIHMQLVGANPNASPVGQQRQPGIVNYFIGDDPSQWHANIPTFGRVQYDDVYPGIDLAYYGGQSPDGYGAGLEYDFIVSPYADPNAITLNFAGADSVEINPQGDLVLHTAAGDVLQQKPFTYQEAGNTRQEVASGYVVDGTQVRFEVGAYDPTRPLVIDPLVMAYSTYLGASSYDLVEGIAVDGSGSAYVTGQTQSPDFPTTPGSFDTTYASSTDSFVTKINASGSSIAYSTFLGGSSGESQFGSGIAVHSDGTAYVTGHTASSNFPTTLGAFDSTYNGSDDAFVARLSANGSTLQYSTFLGGSSSDYGDAIDVDTVGNAYITGRTHSSNFPTSGNAFDASYNGFTDIFMSKLNVDGSAVAYSTFVGGAVDDDAYAISVDDSGQACITGKTMSSNFPTTPNAFDTGHNGVNWDAFATKASADGSAIVFSTFLGGTGDDFGYGIAVDGSANVYVTGETLSSNFPTKMGAFDATHNGGADVFVTKFNPNGSSLGYSTFVGGSSYEYSRGIAVGTGGNVYLAGWTTSSNFPTTPDAFDTTPSLYDVFMTELSANGSALSYSTALGGSNYDFGYGIAVDGKDNVYIAGETHSVNFPTTSGAFDTSLNGVTDGFVTKFRAILRTSASAENAIP